MVTFGRTSSTRTVSYFSYDFLDWQLNDSRNGTRWDQQNIIDSIISPFD